MCHVVVDPDYTYVSGVGLERTSASGSTDRPMNYTVSGGFDGDFVAELHVERVPTSFDIVFFGYGVGATATAFHNEPTDAFLFRIHRGTAGDRVDAVVAKGNSGWPFITPINGVGVFDHPGATFRIERVGSDVTLSIPGQGSQTYNIGLLAGVLNSSNSHIFFGNGSVGTVFSDLVVSSGSDADDDGVDDGDDLCADTPGGALVDGDGCSGAQNVANAAPCDGDWKNHGKYVSAVSHAVEEQVAAGFLTEEEGEAIVSAAGQSLCGHREGTAKGKGKAKKPVVGFDASSWGEIKDSAR